MKMNMSNYEISRDSTETEYGDEYGEEIMNSGWNPSVDLISQEIALDPPDQKKAMPVDLTMVEPEAFIRKMYAC